MATPQQVENRKVEIKGVTFHRTFEIKHKKTGNVTVVNAEQFEGMRKRDYEVLKGADESDADVEAATDSDTDEPADKKKKK